MHGQARAISAVDAGYSDKAKEVTEDAVYRENAGKIHFLRCNHIISKIMVIYAGLEA